MEDNEQLPAPSTEASAPQVVERPLWELSRDEQRELTIAFVGGLTSVVVGAAVIGGAIAMVRGFRALHYPLGFLIIFTAVYIFTAVWGVYARRSAKRTNTAWPKVTWIAWLAGYALFAVLLLAWIGLAAGIH